MVTMQASLGPSIRAGLVMFTSVAFSVLPALPQQAIDQPANLRSRVDLVLVPVQVTAHGQHSANLKQDSFTIFQDGKPQKIAFFEETRTTTERLQRPPASNKEFTNRLIGSPASARYTVIAIDRVNTQTLDLIRVREALSRFLAHAGDMGEPIRLVSIERNGIYLLQDFTTDPKAVSTALSHSGKEVGKPEQNGGIVYDLLQEAESTEDAQGDFVSAGQVAQYIQGLDTAQKNQERVLAFQERERRLNSLEALQQIALSLRGLPGRKSLIWASSGYPFASTVRRGHSRVTHDFSQVSEALQLDADTTRLLNSANIAMYPIDARGLINPAWEAIDPTHKYSPSYAEKEDRQQTNQDVITTFERLAAGTGGKPCYNRAELQDCFKEALDDSRQYYTVGFYLDRKQTKDGWHKLEVRVKEKGVNVRARSGFLFPLAESTDDNAGYLDTSMRSTLVETGIPFTGQWDIPTRTENGKVVHPFTIHVLPEGGVLNEYGKLNLQIVIIARNRDGAIAAQIAKQFAPTLTPEAIALVKKSGVFYKNFLPLGPGDYLVRFVIQDNLTGRTGAVNSWLKAQ
jgi:VWFA-related protein